MTAHSVLLDQFVLMMSADPPVPTLISVPHDGALQRHLRIPLSERTNGTTGRDTHVWDIVRDILDDASASVVRGLLPRTLVDYNRDPTEAFDHDAVSAPYLAYHRYIDACIGLMKEHLPTEKLLLLDMHGFVGQPSYAPPNGYDIIMGTGNRTTIPHGDVDRQFARFLQARGYTVFLPENEPVQPEGDRMNGGYIVRHHAATHRINCIQVEIAPRFRDRDMTDIGKRLARDIARFLQGRL
jgi:N-formylglutamate amidohydrolase